MKDEFEMISETNNVIATICDEFGMFVMSFDPFLDVGGRFVVIGDDLGKVWGRIAFILESYIEMLGQFEAFVGSFERLETNLRGL